MSIPSVTGAARVPSSTADNAAATATATAARQNSTDPTTGEEAAYKTPAPPRFPWLSRLSRQLESAAKQKPTFAPAPILGDHVDKSA